MELFAPPIPEHEIRHHDEEHGVPSHNLRRAFLHEALKKSEHADIEVVVKIPRGEGQRNYGPEIPGLEIKTGRPEVVACVRQGGSRAAKHLPSNVRNKFVETAPQIIPQQAVHGIHAFVLDEGNEKVSPEQPDHVIRE